MDRVCGWLASLGPQYGQYADLFEAQGWDDMDNVSTMSEADLQTLGITKAGHVNKLKITINKLNEQEQFAFPSQNVNLQDNKNEQNQDKVSRQPSPNAANNHEDTSQREACLTKTTEMHDDTQPLARENTAIADPQQLARENTVITDPQQLARENTVIADPQKLTRERTVIADPQQLARESTVIADPQQLTRERTVIADPQQLTNERTITADSQQLAAERTVFADQQHLTREGTITVDSQQSARESSVFADPQQSRREGSVIDDPTKVHVKEDSHGDETGKYSTNIDTALVLTHDSAADESESESDKDQTEPLHNVLMRLPQRNAASAERSPTVAQLSTASSTSIHRSMIVKDSKDVTIAETVEIHQHDHTDDSHDNFKGQIKTFMRNYKKTEHLFVKTRAYKEVSDILEDSNWAVIIGNPGYGKSTMALHQMLEHSRHGYESIIVTSVIDWKSMIAGQYSDSKKQFVVIDDIFGSLSVDERMLYDWMSVFDFIDKLIIEKKGCLKVICTTRKYTFSQVSTKLKRFKLFGNLHAVDMTEERYKLLQIEKIEMLTKFLQHYKIKTKDTLIESASKVASDYGFPHCVEMFCTRTTLRERGLGFFKTPLELLEKEIENLVENDKDKYCALLMVMLSFNGFDITYLDRQRADLRAISGSLKLSRMRNDTFLPDFVSAFKLLDNVFIREKNKGIYTFKHDSFKEIVSIVTFKYYPQLSLQMLDLSSIVEITKYFTYKPAQKEIVVVLPESCTSQLIKRFNEEIYLMNGRNVSKHQVWNEKYFILKWLQSIKTSSSIDRSRSLECHHFSSGLLKSGFLTSLCENNKEEAVFLILKDEEFSNIVNSEDGKKALTYALNEAINEGCSKALCAFLIQHGADVNFDVYDRLKEGYDLKNVTNRQCKKIDWNFHHYGYSSKKK